MIGLKNKRVLYYNYDHNNIKDMYHLRAGSVNDVLKVIYFINSQPISLLGHKRIQYLEW